MALNHRALQRALFRMQLDADFARRLRAGESSALRSTDLGPAELAALRGADPLAIAADRDGARRAQLLRNVGSEFRLSLALLDADVLESFPRSRDFHRAVERGTPFPLALGRHLARSARGAALEVEAIATLERSMARARRRRRPVAAPPTDCMVLAGCCELLDLPEGTLDFAMRLRERLDRGDVALPPARLGAGTCERLLIHAHAPSPPARLHHVEVERLSPALGRFLCEARRPLSRAARARLAAELDASPDELDALASELAAAGILLDPRSVRPASGAI